jgi:hypothetical protein
MKKMGLHQIKSNFYVWNHNIYSFSDVDDVIPSSVGKFSRWYNNHSHLLMAIYLVSVVVLPNFL